MKFTLIVNILKVYKYIQIIARNKKSGVFR
jgi:hypothetical protein